MPKVIGYAYDHHPVCPECAAKDGVSGSLDQYDDSGFRVLVTVLTEYERGAAQQLYCFYCGVGLRNRG